MFKRKLIKMFKIDNLNTLSSDEYYIKDGYVVFTEKYHLEKGYCCKNKCRHCPYGKKPSADAKKESKS